MSGSRHASLSESEIETTKKKTRFVATDVALIKSIEDDRMET